MAKFFILLLTIILIAIGGCSDSNWNNPHEPNKQATVYHSSFSEQPKTLDPAKAYNANENTFIAQIYEPPLQYHYLKRPYELVPLTAAQLPKVTYLDVDGNQLPNDADANLIAYSIYDIKIKPGIFYHPHPAFAKNSAGSFLYHNLTQEALRSIENISDFQKSDTRELIAEDYVYQIKRLAHPKLQSPIFGLMSERIVGLKQLNQELMLGVLSGNTTTASQLFAIENFEGAKAISRYHYQIKLKGKYQQFIYWLAMPFFAPVPWEADAFYNQKELIDKNITLDWFPVGTGPYWLSDNDPNRQIVLKRNNYYRTEYYPGTTEPLPFIDEYKFSLEKESIPRWSKFLQGYYDQSAISSDNFDQAIKITSKGGYYLSEELKNKHLKLETSVSPAIYYFGFNMLDSIVGGYSKRAKKLRQAISIALDFEEYINIFLNGRGIAAQNPIPPGVFGYSEMDKKFNKYIYTKKEGKVERKNIEEAKKLLAEAGYPNGRDEKTGKPLVLHFDTAGAGTESQAMFAWLIKQFNKLGIQLQIRSTQYNRFQQKMQLGNAQMYMWGWLADYPDPENFLFLLYGPNGKMQYGGENASNYQNTEFDKLFEKMRNLPNGSQRKETIEKMIEIVQEDAPWAWGYYPKQFQLSHHWISNNIPNAVANNFLKYQKLNPEERENYQIKWNKPILWPIFGLLFFILLGLVPVSINYWRKQNQNRQKER